METIKTIFWIICAAFFLLEVRALLRSILSTIRASRWMKKNKHPFSKKFFFFEKWKENYLSCKLYESTFFQRTMLKLWYVKNFSKDEFHPWLNMQSTEDMSPKQRRKYRTMLEKIRYKKDILKT